MIVPISPLLLSTLRRFSAGVLASAAGVIVVYPWDTVKTRLQNDNGKYRGTWDCFRSVYQEEGIGGLFRGVGTQAIGKGPEKGFQLFLVDALKRSLSKGGEMTVSKELMSGAIAGAVQVLTSNPFEVVKVKLQTQVKDTSAIQIAKSVGIRGLFKGTGACLMRDVSYAALYTTIYSRYKGLMSSPLSPGRLFLGGCVAGGVSSWITTPADVVKTRVQASKEMNGESGVKLVVDIVKDEGIHGLFRGATARVARSTQQYGVMLWVYDALKKYLRV